MLRGLGIILIFIGVAYAHDSERVLHCYRVDDRGPQYLEQSPYQLCMSSSDLKRYPKSIITVTLTKSIEGGSKSEVLAKRYYVMLHEDEFGRRTGPEHEQQSLVVFDREQNTVDLGFVSKGMKKFFYKPIEKEQVQAQRQKLQLGKLDTQ